MSVSKVHMVTRNKRVSVGNVWVYSSNAALPQAKPHQTVSFQDHHAPMVTSIVANWLLSVPLVELVSVNPGKNNPWLVNL